ncbi:uncharacterized protein PV07_08660 [Cladophialophora immunda]|uniref:Uncharacterized protein n=1 Tax=Cladophialophora immunda TaxID=569365 RepID=A0A0D2CPM8_9EURO|nr:uncharacterized protein PV07_08660 [Cladophialophora immunda]KIW25494.1 hypothetical protein PV07_08660 [Cladophialophora immunda]
MWPSRNVPRKVKLVLPVLRTTGLRLSAMRKVIWLANVPRKVKLVPVLRTTGLGLSAAFAMRRVTVVRCPQGQAGGMAGQADAGNANGANDVGAGWDNSPTSNSTPSG